RLFQNITCRSKSREATCSALVVGRTWFFCLDGFALLSHHLSHDNLLVYAGNPPVGFTSSRCVSFFKIFVRVSMRQDRACSRLMNTSPVRNRPVNGRQSRL